MGAAFVVLAGAETLAVVFVSLCFDSALAERDEVPDLALFRAVALLLAAALFVVDFVAIKKFLGFGHGRLTKAPACYCAAGVSW